MDPSPLRVVLVFNADDQTWLRRSSLSAPDFWRGHGVAPALGDEFRLGGRQFTIRGRMWAQDEEGTVLRVFAGSAHAESDSVFG
jgi:hypothetical protein